MVWAAVAVALLFAPTLAAAHQPVPIRNVQSLTLQKDRLTTGRRSAPVSQLACRGANCQHAPSSVRCVNAGWDGVDVQWDCKAELDPSVRFGNLNVQCEGYEYPDDPNILAGSCGLEFTLDSTGAPSASGSSYSGGYGHYHSSSESGGSLLGSILVLGLICMAFSACAGGGGSHGGSCYHNGGYGGGYYRSPSYGSSSGFWTGAAAGALGATALRGRSYGGGRSGWGGGRSSYTSTGYASTSRR